ncbi:bacillithiol biosynthesis deacetylase BshB1 [Salsuginibacillus halophilus]|uniref:Bacillithiol biosynthesis deacetylase BshB1 n=1 Tax=Salsuginibacillus halophilus TaxID=517424 RepID=A0A2P8HWC8_9BACI|nr:bacillithiol biosynthesis deacetylase BshB1 [Salsuginibacillus halophilus]PSL50527.1 bacillithiol biosynthesis deacetylase BshB1 [Salsuginibacillus halophilus]
MTKPVDLLAFSAHPDDAEIGMAATLHQKKQEGARTAICSITCAELSSNGTPAMRQEEAAAAAAVLGVDERIQLEAPDRGLVQQMGIIEELTEVIRQYQPRLVFAPWHEDRHPDHGAAASLVREAVFNARIRHYETATPAVKTVEKLYYYFINGMPEPQFFVDVSNSMHAKKQALNCYQSQFEGGADSVQTPLTDGYIEAVTARERAYGRQAGTTYAEGFMSEYPIVFRSL